MLIRVDDEDRRPIYQQVADEIKSLIARGDLRDGQTLPPVRQLAADLGVNLNTIAVAYRELQAQGLISIRHGSGAVILPRDSARKSVAHKDDLRKPLRAALTQMVLQGMRRGEILTAVSDELKALLKGAK